MDQDDSCDAYGEELDFGDKTEGEQDNLGGESAAQGNDPDHSVDSCLRSKEKDEKWKELEVELEELRRSKQAWESAGLKIAESLGEDFDVENIDKLVDSVQQYVKGKEKRQKDLEAQCSKVAGLQYHLSQQQMEMISLRESLHKARLLGDPSVIQLKQLLLDPALQKEFNFLKSEVEEKNREIRKLQEELDGVTFTQESKAGKMLVAKCKKLQEENEDMGRDLAEGRVHHLETQLALAKNFAEEMRKKCMELEEHCCALDEEAEDLQQQIFQLEAETSRSGGPPPPPNPPNRSPQHRSPRDASPGVFAGDRYERKGRDRSRDRKRGPPPEHISSDRMSEHMSPERGGPPPDCPPPGRMPQQFPRRRMR